jgi:hypothetical protein
MHELSLSFIGILTLSAAKRLQHERIGEGFIDDTDLGMTNTHSIEITTTSKKSLTNDEI